MQVFRVRLCQDDPALDPALTPAPKLRLIGKLRENMTLAKRLLYVGNTGDGAVTEQAQAVLDVVATMKQPSRYGAIPWDTFLRYALAEALPVICNELRDMIANVHDKRANPTSMDARTMPMALKFASGGGCRLNDEDKTTFVRQFQYVCRPPNILLVEAELLVQMVGSAVSSYPPGRDDIVYISSAESLTP